VAEYKYTLNWQLKRFIGKGRDKQLSSGKKIPIFQKVFLSFRTIAVLFFYGIKLLPKLLFNKNYFFQNYILDILNYPCLMFGMLTV
ncbi:MAG: hypothetical protein NT127_06565, partial [Sphingobacteriales bacterium]|nr:hypothetical protein [Sphingobacteriales bacterium]